MKEEEVTVTVRRLGLVEMTETRMTSETREKRPTRGTIETEATDHRRGLADRTGSGGAASVACQGRSSIVSSPRYILIRFLRQALLLANQYGSTWSSAHPEQRMKVWSISTASECLSKNSYLIQIIITKKF
jgi:hypothetical protein